VLIYAIRNTVNGKVYIGQTQRSLERRWSKKPGQPSFLFEAA